MNNCTIRSMYFFVCILNCMLQVSIPASYSAVLMIWLSKLSAGALGQYVLSDSYVVVHLFSKGAPRACTAQCSLAWYVLAEQTTTLNYLINEYSFIR